MSETMTLRETYARDICQNPGVPLEDCPRRDEHYALVDERLAGLVPWIRDVWRCLSIGLYSWQQDHTNEETGAATYRGSDGPFGLLVESTETRLAAIVAALEDRT